MMMMMMMMLILVRLQWCFWRCEGLSDAAACRRPLRQRPYCEASPRPEVWRQRSRTGQRHYLFIYLFIYLYYGGFWKTYGRLSLTWFNLCHKLRWVSEMRYLGVYFVQSRSFKCSLDAAKRGFYRAANIIFGKVGRIASEEVIIQLILNKSNE